MLDGADPRQGDGMLGGAHRHHPASPRGLLHQLNAHDADLEGSTVEGGDGTTVRQRGGEDEYEWTARRRRDHERDERHERRDHGW